MWTNTGPQPLTLNVNGINKAYSYRYYILGWAIRSNNDVLPPGRSNIVKYVTPSKTYP